MSAMIERKKGTYPGLIDEPSPFAPIAEWEDFARSIEPLALEWESVQVMLDDARRLIAGRKVSGGELR